MVPTGPPDPALSFPTIGKNVRGDPRGPGAGIRGVGGERWGGRRREGEGERRSLGGWSQSRGGDFKK